MRVYNTPGGSGCADNGRKFESFERFVQDNGNIGGSLGSDNGTRTALIGPTAYVILDSGSATNLYVGGQLRHTFQREAGSTVDAAYIAGNMVYLVVLDRGSYYSLVYDLGSGVENRVYRRFVAFTATEEFYVEDRNLYREGLNSLYQTGIYVAGHVGDAGVVVTDSCIYYVQDDNPGRLVGFSRGSGAAYATFGLSGTGTVQFAMNNNNVYVLDNNTLYRFTEGAYAMNTLCSFAVDASATVDLLDVTKDFVFAEMKGNVNLGGTVYRSVSVAVNLNDGTLYLTGLSQ